MNICDYEGKTRGEDTHFDTDTFPSRVLPSPSHTSIHTAGPAAANQGACARAPLALGYVAQWRGSCSDVRQTRFKSLSCLGRTRLIARGLSSLHLRVLSVGYGSWYLSAIKIRSSLSNACTCIQWAPNTQKHLL